MLLQHDITRIKIPVLVQFDPAHGVFPSDY